MTMSRATVARVAAPLAFLLAATVAVLLVRAGLRENDAPAGSTGDVVAVTTGQQHVTVRRGDTLQSIAAKSGTSVAELRRLNPGVDPAALQVGLTIRVK
jgi:LysM repeat protein